MKEFKTYMTLFVAIFLLLLSGTSFAQNRIVEGDIFPNIYYNKNFVINYGAEVNVTTGVSSTMTVSRTTTSSKLIEGKASFEINPTASSQYVRFHLSNLGTGLEGKDCEVSFDHRSTSGTMTAIYAQLVSGVTTVASSTVTASTDVNKFVMFVPCKGLSPSSSYVELVSTASTPTQNLIVDKVEFGALKSYSNGSIITQQTVVQGITIGAVTTAPTKPTGGNVLVDKITYKFNGNVIQADYEYTQNSAGTATAGSGDYLVTLPNGLSFDTTLVTPSTVASNSCSARDLQPAYVGEVHWGTNNGSNRGVGKAFAYDSTRFRVCFYDNNGSSQLYNTWSSGYWSLTNSGFAIKIRIEAAIANIKGTTTSFHATCPNDVSCTNEFSAKVAADGTVTGENVDWISGNCTNANPRVCTFNTSIFTESPNCTVTNGPDSGRDEGITSESSSSISVLTYNATGTPSQYPFRVHCQKAGADFKPRKVIEAALNKTLSTNGTFNQRLVTGKFGGASETTACSASPCTQYRSSGDITSVTRSGTGQYTVNVAAGVFSGVFDCQATPGVSGQIRSPIWLPSSATAGSLQFMDHTNNFQDASFSVTCIGPRL